MIRIRVTGWIIKIGLVAYLGIAGGPGFVWLSWGTEAAVGPLGTGSPAPQFSVVSLDGAALDLEALKGKVVVLNFWFIACPPCRIEIPILNDLVDTFHGEDVVFIGFAPDSKDELKVFLETKEFKYQVIADATPIAELYGVTGAPTHLIIDKTGRIAYRLNGAIDDQGTQLEPRIRALLE